MAGGRKQERLSEASDPSARLFVDALSLRVSAATMTVVMVLSPVVAFAQSVPAGVANIVPDGRTATAVTTNGAVSTVTTNTVSGPNAFNSFSRFQVGRGATGNLILPQGTSNLVNLINGNDPAVINGVVNSYKNGQIGGNVYFASPNGFVVGSTGVVNVGSLNVSTPTREFVDGVIGRNGQINQGAVDNLLAGTVPLSPEGNIRIRGRVNAVNAVFIGASNELGEFRAGTVEKVYWAVVEGACREDAGEWFDTLWKDEQRNVVEVVPQGTAGGRDARLGYRVVGRGARTTTLELRPLTGRSHQLRVQLASRGMPIVGDRKYGACTALRALDGGNRIALHARRLSFTHPTRKEAIAVDAPVPADWPASAARESGRSSG